MITVFPTPAPPNIPILPPLTKGHSKSITFTPVSKSSVVGSMSAISGASLCIGIFIFVLTSSPIKSIGSPRTLKSLPSVSLPTGTSIGFPVSITSIPLSSPSVDDMATALTWFAPMDCWTSKTTLFL